MSFNTYQYLLADLSLILSRNVYACSRGRKIGEYSASDVVRMTIQTMNKLARDYKITSDKIIFVADSWSPEYDGYYRTWLLSGNYKDNRTWMTQEKFDAIKSNPESTEAEIKKAEEELYQNNVKIEAKRILKTECSRIGLPCLGVPGLEYDDLCYIISSLLYVSGVSKKSVIVTKDSDCMFNTSPVCDYFRIPVGGSDPEVKTYDEIYTTYVPVSLRNRGISLYDYKGMLDSLFGGHNAMRKTTTYSKNYADSIIEEIMSGNYSSVSDIDLFKLQYSTFNLSKFPMINEAVETVKKGLSTIGHLGNLEEFKEFCNTNNITGISDKYYETFISRFDQKLFSE